MEHITIGLLMVFVIIIVVAVVVIVVRMRNACIDNIDVNQHGSNTQHSPAHNNKSGISTTNRKYNDNKMSAYLNYSSTDATKTGVFNTADLAYPPVIDIRKNYIKACNYIRKYVNAPTSARVIINSGATESIANMVWWAKNYIPNGIIVGSDYDHSALPLNCANMSVPYAPALKNPVLPDNVAMLYLTHVDGKSGNIMNIDNYVNNVLKKYTFMNNPGTTSVQMNDDNKFLRQNRPIIAVDVTQSITKIPIDMQKWGANALFFSLHKLGGPMGMGVLVVMDVYPDRYCPAFKPLIAGYQQMGLRGGTWDMEEFVNAHRCITDNDEKNKRKNKWVEGYEKLEELGIKLVKPEANHMYNTYLIEVPGCPLGVINALARQGIYVGSASSCSNEALNDKNILIRQQLYGDEGLSGGNRAEEQQKRYIRLSFNKSDDFTMETLEDVARVLKSFMDDRDDAGTE